MKWRLSLLYFLQFSVWGCYLPCLGQFLGAGGLGGKIAWFYAAIGLVSIISPPLLGRLADKTDNPSRILGICHFAAALIMLFMWRYGMKHSQLDFNIFFPLYLSFLLLYMPTMALANTASFGLLTANGKNPVTVFPSIRIWGTVGFVSAMWFVNSAYWLDGKFGFAFSDLSDPGRIRFQYNAMQLLCSGIMGGFTAVFTLFLPKKKINSEKQSPSVSVLKEDMAFSLKTILGKHEIIIFLIFVALSGVCLQISNGFATPYITHFSGMREYAGSFASGNATMLFSLSQISEAICILFVGVCMKWRGIRWVYGIGLFAWAMRFLFLGIGNPGDGLWLLIGSMLIYGVAFNFITIAGHLHIQRVAPENMKGFAQGLMMVMSNGLGATFGTICAGAIVNHWCSWQPVNIAAEGVSLRLFMGDWHIPWLIFAGYAFLIAVAWLLATISLKNKDING